MGHWSHEAQQFLLPLQQRGRISMCSGLLGLAQCCLFPRKGTQRAELLLLLGGLTAESLCRKCLTCWSLRPGRAGAIFRQALSRVLLSLPVTFANPHPCCLSQPSPSSLYLLSPVPDGLLLLLKSLLPGISTLLTTSAFQGHAVLLLTCCLPRRTGRERG